MAGDRRILVLAMLAVLCLAAPACGPWPAPPGLSPDLSLSFATLTESELVVCLVGDGFALRVLCPRGPGALPHGVRTPRLAEFCQGEDLATYYRPSAGVPTPPVPGTIFYLRRPVEDLAVTVLSGHGAREPAGWLEVALSEFSAGRDRFGPTGPLRLPLRGPYP